MVIWSWFVDNIKYLNELLQEYNPLMILEKSNRMKKKKIGKLKKAEKNINEFKLEMKGRYY
jgi:hypothetical protein